MRSTFPHHGAQSAIDRIVTTIWNEWRYHQDILDSPALLHDRLTELQSRQSLRRRRTLNDFLPNRSETRHSSHSHSATLETQLLSPTNASSPAAVPTTSTTSTTVISAVPETSSPTSIIPALLNKCVQCRRGRPNASCTYHLCLTCCAQSTSRCQVSSETTS